MPRNKYHDTVVVEFHEAFGHPVAWKPTVPDLDIRKLRIKLILEELLEYATASGLTLCVNGQDIMFQSLSLIESGTPSIPDAADGLGDLRYVIDGANLVWGIPGEKVLREVHFSNMSKLGPDGKPLVREDGKILKGPHFNPPRIAEILDLYSGSDNRG